MRAGRTVQRRIRRESYEDRAELSELRIQDEVGAIKMLDPSDSPRGRAHGRRRERTELVDERIALAGWSSLVRSLHARGCISVVKEPVGFRIEPLLIWRAVVAAAILGVLFVVFSLME
jgi:hypothetical protein